MKSGPCRGFCSPRIGNEWRTIFRDDADRECFVRRLGESVEQFEVRLYLFCLMSNHIHLAVETPRANLGRLMHRLQTAYTVYFKGSGVTPTYFTFALDTLCYSGFSGNVAGLCRDETLLEKSARN